MHSSFVWSITAIDELVFSSSFIEIVDTDLEQYEDEDSSSDAEGEWVPSCWDSLAQPSRSALKSPDKSSSVSVIFLCDS